MNPKFEPKDLESLTFSEYRRLFMAELKRMKAAYPDSTTPAAFIVIGEHEFPDAKGKAVPFMVIGKLKGEWENYFKTTLRKRKERDFALGRCFFGGKDAEGELFNMEVLAGRVKPKTEDLITKALLKPQGYKANIIDKSTDSGEEETTTQESKPLVAPVTPPKDQAKESDKDKGKDSEKEKAKQAKIEAHQKEMKAQAEQLNALLAAFRQSYGQANTQVVPKVQTKKPTNRTDLVLLDKVIKDYDAFMKAYKGVHKQVQATFNGPQSLLQKQSKEIAKLAVAARARKQTLAEQLANKYFQKAAQRDATEEEATAMQAAIKAAMDYRQLSQLSAPDRLLALQAIYLTAELRGPKFRPQDTDVVVARMRQRGR